MPKTTISGLSGNSGAAGALLLLLMLLLLAGMWAFKGRAMSNLGVDLLQKKDKAPSADGVVFSPEGESPEAQASRYYRDQKRDRR